EIGAVVAAAPAENVRRERPVPGDIVILLGGATGRDGIGGATGSSKAHDSHSVETCGAEVQKGNAPEERKLQRLFRNPQATRLIKRCNDFGAGGVSVAIGELADGLEIDLNAVPKKYEGLDGTELAISESQERMAVVVAAQDEAAFMELASAENLAATRVAVVTELPRLVMHWNGETIVDISREFLDSNGARKEAKAHVAAPAPAAGAAEGSFSEKLRALARDLNICSKRGLSERFDSTIGAATVLMPFGGKYQLTPAQAMAHKLPLDKGETDTCSLMAYGFDPYLSERSPYHGAYTAVVESVARLVATGASTDDTYLSFQEYFEKLGSDPARWGKPVAALLGAFKAQLDLGFGSIGGKDSMSGSFENIHVPPTLVSFAVTADKASHVVSPELKEAGHKLVLLQPERGGDGLPLAASQLALFDTVTKLLREKKAVSAWTPGMGGAAEALMKMAFGNGLGVRFQKGLDPQKLFEPDYGAFILEMADGSVPDGAVLLGEVTEDPVIRLGEEAVPLAELLADYENRLEGVYPCNIPAAKSPAENVSFTAGRPQAPRIRCVKPKVLIPVFPGTTWEYDRARAVEAAGAKAQVTVLRNRSAEDVARSVEAFAKALNGAQAVF
ncbi:MAG: phosphoribosylformylglycinamidine synthase subunit PurQ, partial [Oscillospiraceae bacterium]|nr:phosphoribosylformylglycinamidine synthase subunit PurQ [Oscillospiraceae bacterium]